MTIENKKQSDAIHKDMLISEVVDNYPDVIPLLMESGMHCIGCGASMFETLEEGFMAHGKDDKEIEKITVELNEYITKISKNTTKESK